MFQTASRCMDSQHDLRHFHLLIPSTVVVWILHSIVIGFWELWFGFFTLSWSDSENFWNQGGAHWTNRMWICFICFIYLCSIGHCHGQVVVCWGPSMWSGVTAGPRIQDGASWCPCANASPVFHDPFILFSPSDSFIKLSWNWHERRERTYGPWETRGIEAAKHNDVSVSREAYRILACVASLSVAKIGPDSNQLEMGVNHICRGKRREKDLVRDGQSLVASAVWPVHPVPVAQMASGFAPIVCFR